MEVQQNTKYQAILEQYDCSFESSKMQKIGNGLINQTYKVVSSNKSFILQQINQQVFNTPKQVINNADKINQYLLKKQNGYSLELIPQLKTNKHESYVSYQAPNSKTIEVWRALKLISQSKTIETVENAIQAQKVAAAFGEFSNALTSFDANLLNVVIPDFHNLEFRLDQLETAIEQNKNSRKAQVENFINFCRQQSEFVSEVVQLQKCLPCRVTHNDTKINNLLFDSKTNNPVAVIDLDTCMPGFLMNDFGDMVRTCCSNLTEDAVDIERMQVRMDIFNGLAKGYIQSFGETLGVLERQSLIVGAQLLPFICGVRFLTDYLDGDIYFNTHYEQHNLDRAANQLHFYSLLTNSKKEMTEFILK